MSSQRPLQTRILPESLRKKSQNRKTLQDHIDVLKDYKVRFFALLTRQYTRLPDTDPYPVVSPLAEAQQLWSDLETLMLEVPPIASVPAQSVYLPTTGDIEIKPIPQAHPYTRSTAPADDEFLTQQKVVVELLLHCQGHIREFYQSHSPKHMPRLLRTGALNYFNLKPLCPNGYFPETDVRIALDLSLGDTIVCSD